ISKISIPRRIPKRITENGVIFYGDREDSRCHFKGSLLEHHHSRIVDASSFREDEDWQLFHITHMFTHFPDNSQTVSHFTTVKEDMGSRPTQRPLHQSQESFVKLSDKSER